MKTYLKAITFSGLWLAIISPANAQSMQLQKEVSQYVESNKNNVNFLQKQDSIASEIVHTGTSTSVDSAEPDKPAYGTRLPAIPVLTFYTTAGGDPEDGQHELYRAYTAWISTYITKKHCDPEYLAVFNDLEKKLPAESTWKAKSDLRRQCIEFLKKKCQ
ncbi:MAG TPA: hypothetical protein VJ844_04950 [Mucilaginibacter sp.]|nr:hypothetical protein [Mucilaginibacter sp.]